MKSSIADCDCAIFLLSSDSKDKSSDIGCDVFDAFVISARIVRSTVRRNVSFARIAVFKSSRSRDSVGDGGAVVDGAVDAHRAWYLKHRFVRGAVSAREDRSRNMGDCAAIVIVYNQYDVVG